jgi:two-component system cell cycle sensor histidine kinase/response regulator CckA
LTAEPSSPRPSETTILVVDDEDHVRDLVKDVLEGEGYIVITEADPRVARRIAESQTVHLLLTDVVMPAMSGLELADRVEAAGKKTKILLMSGYMTAATKASGRTCLAKPFTVDALLGAVRESLTVRRSAFNRPEGGASGAR